MKHSKLAGYLGIISLGFLISSDFLILIIDSFLGFILGTISTVLLFILICAIIAAFFNRYSETGYLFKRRRNPILIPLGRRFHILYGIMLLIVTSVFLVVSFFYSESMIGFNKAISIISIFTVYVLWIISGIIALIAGFIYDDKISEKDMRKECEHLERKRVLLKKKSEKKGKKLDSIRFDKAQCIINIEAKIKEIENDESLSEREKIDEIKRLIDKLKALKLKIN